MDSTPLWITLVDKCLQLVDIGHRRRREVFDGPLTTIHHVFGKVHRNYSLLFEAMLSACPASSEPGTEAALRAAKAAFAKNRKQLEPDRIDVRARVSACLKAPLQKEEKNYVFGVFSYLLYPDHPIESAQGIEALIKFIALRGSVRALRTPSSKFLEEIDGVFDAGEVFKLVQDRQHQLNARWREVSELWAATEIAVIRSTTALKP